MKAKVWNDNDYVYKEYFKGENIVIPPKKFIEMDYDEAILFRGTFNSISRDADGQPKPESYKKIRIEAGGEIEKATTVTDPNKCQACSKVLPDQGSLAQHIFDEHPESMAHESRDEAVSALNKMKSQSGKGK